VPSLKRCHGPQQNAPVHGERDTKNSRRRRRREEHLMEERGAVEEEEE